MALQVDAIDTAIAQIEATIKEGRPPRDTLAQIQLSGATTLAEWSIFQTAIDRLRAECAALTVKGEDALKWVVKVEDLDALDAQGSVRAAAETLSLRRDDPALSQDDRNLAAHALRLLFGLAASVDERAR